MTPPLPNLKQQFEKKIAAKKVPEFLEVMLNLVLKSPVPQNLDGIPARYPTVSITNAKQALKYLQILDSLAAKPEITFTQLLELLTIGSTPEQPRAIIQAKYKDDNASLLNQHGLFLQTLVTKLTQNYSAANLSTFIRILQLPLLAHGKEAMPWMHILLQEGKEALLKTTFNQLLALGKLPNADIPAILTLITNGSPNLFIKALMRMESVNDHTYILLVGNFCNALIQPPTVDRSHTTALFKNSLQHVLLEMQSSKKITIAHQLALQRLQLFATTSGMVAHISEADFASTIKNIVTTIKKSSTLKAQNVLLEELKPLFEFFYNSLGAEKFNSWVNNALAPTDRLILASLTIYTPATPKVSFSQESPQENPVTTVVNKINTFSPALQELTQKIKAAAYNLATIRTLEEDPRYQEITSGIRTISTQINSVKAAISSMSPQQAEQNRQIFKEFQQQISAFQAAYRPIKAVRDLVNKIEHFLPKLESFISRLADQQQFADLLLHSAESATFFPSVTDIQQELADLGVAQYMLTPAQQQSVASFNQLIPDLHTTTASYCERSLKEIHALELTLDDILVGIQDAGADATINSAPIAQIFQQLNTIIANNTLIAKHNMLTTSPHIENETNIIAQYSKELVTQFFTEILKPGSHLSPAKKTNCILLALENNLLTSEHNKLLESNITTNQLALEPITQAASRFHRPEINSISKSIFVTLLSHANPQQTPHELVHPDFVHRHASVDTPTEQQQAIDNKNTQQQPQFHFTNH